MGSEKEGQKDTGMGEDGYCKGAEDGCVAWQGGVEDDLGNSSCPPQERSSGDGVCLLN